MYIHSQRFFQEAFRFFRRNLATFGISHLICGAAGHNNVGKTPHVQVGVSFKGVYRAGYHTNIIHLCIFSAGKRPSLTELYSIVIPGPKEVRVIRTVATKWKRLALELGFELSVIERIGNRIYSDAEEDCEAMLRKWLLRPDVSWEVLMTALDNIGLNSIAQDLKKGIAMD